LRGILHRIALIGVNCWRQLSSILGLITDDDDDDDDDGDKTKWFSTLQHRLKVR